jgi:hypothetical protein
MVLSVSPVFEKNSRPLNTAFQRGARASASTQPEIIQEGVENLICLRQACKCRGERSYITIGLRTSNNIPQAHQNL